MTKDELRKHYNEIFDRLQEYEVAEEQGKLLRPPCKVGQTVFCIIDGFDAVMEGRVRFYTVHKDCILYEVAINGYYAQRYSNKDFGKTVFLTREEAEAKLKEGGKGEKQQNIL